MALPSALSDFGAIVWNARNGRENSETLPSFYPSTKPARPKPRVMETEYDNVSFRLHNAEFTLLLVEELRNYYPFALVALISNLY